MNQITLRGFDRDLLRVLQQLALSEGVSLNQAALRLLRKGAGLSPKTHSPIGHALDPFVGTLSPDDADAVEESVRRADEAELALQRRGRSTR